MTVSDDELIARLEAACIGHPHAEIPWPHRILHEAAARLRSLSESKREMVEALSGCRWYWPEDDTSSESCADSAQEVVEAAYGWETPSGEIVAVARGGVVEVTYCASLPPADDADSDDEFWVEEASEEAARSKIAAEIDRRARAVIAKEAGHAE